MYATYEKAKAAAVRTAKRRGVWMYVWRDGPDEFGIGDDIDADTYYLGLDSIATIGPGGEVEYER